MCNVSIRNVLWIFILGIFVSCSSPTQNKENTLVIFHAGSLAVPFSKIIQEFKKENPGIEVYAESSGSLAAARKITDLNKPCDVLAVADYLVIDHLMIPTYADSNFYFASNEMVIGFQEKSKYANEIDVLNWPDILLKEDVKMGRSDPDADPCGYRSLFVFDLTESYYQKPGIANQLKEKKETIIRPKEVDLLALIETGNLDYILIYKSVAIQHKLRY
ncbi:MAG: tungstate ABC transporter substrate-binding protein WtpA, partial [Bacteroidetes bacterium HGW-Bacteroidetes-21]